LPQATDLTGAIFDALVAKAFDGALDA